MAGVEEVIFWQNHWKFRFVTLPQEIPDKMELHPWNFQNLYYTPWIFQCLYLRLMEIPHDFFLITPVNSFSLAPGISTFYLEILCPQPPPSPPVCFFSEILIYAVTLTVYFQFLRVVNILLRRFDTPSKKEVKMIKM